MLRFAEESGLSPAALRRLHLDYVHLLIRATEADGIITEQEQSTISSVSELLGIRADIPQASAPCDSRPQDGHSPLAITLHPGDRVTVTGPVEKTQQYWEEFFAAQEVQVAGIARSTKVVIAGDPDSQSGKAEKARSYGIPIIGETSVDSVLCFAEPSTTLF